MKFLVIFVFLFTFGSFSWEFSGVGSDGAPISNVANATNAVSDTAGKGWFEFDNMQQAGVTAALGQAVKMANLGAKGHFALSGAYTYMGYSNLPGNKPAASMWFIQAAIELANGVMYKDAEKKAHHACLKASTDNNCRPDLPELADIATDLGLPEESPFVDENGNSLGYDEAFSDLKKAHVKGVDGKPALLSSFNDEASALKDLGMSDKEIADAKKKFSKQFAKTSGLKKNIDTKLARIAKRGNFNFPFSRSSGFDLQAALNSVLKRQKIVDMRTKKEGNDKDLNNFKEVHKGPQIFLLVSKAYSKQMTKHEFLD